MKKVFAETSVGESDLHVCGYRYQEPNTYILI